jgi:hypothetical protein
MAKKALYVGQPGTSAAAIYTSSSITTSVFQASVCNPGGTARTFDLWSVPNGGTAADGNALYKEKSIAAGETVALSAIINLTLDSGESLQALASAANSLTFRISGDTA